MNMSLKIEHINNVDKLYLSRRITGEEGVDFLTMNLEIVLVLMMKINYREIKTAMNEIRIKILKI